MAKPGNSEQSEPLVPAVVHGEIERAMRRAKGDTFVVCAMIPGFASLEAAPLSSADRLGLQQCCLQLARELNSRQRHLPIHAPRHGMAESRSSLPKHIMAHVSSMGSLSCAQSRSTAGAPPPPRHLFCATFPAAAIEIPALSTVPKREILADGSFHPQPVKHLSMF